MMVKRFVKNRKMLVIILLLALFIHVACNTTPISKTTAPLESVITPTTESPTYGHFVK
ncbi:hypothetical protein MNBD_CHLOROFLEXI01-4345 [hydrothermal vent metagenome]|uniref:Uncharacterized protein n=1 Tax=hydrothermal vent metagenome TaxID=652676 RepID=A0A3B0WEC9_9ZZZZ